MKFTFGSSKKGNVTEALNGIREPAALFFSVADENMLADTATEIEKSFPGVPSVGGVGQAYIGKQFYDTGITVIAMQDHIKVVADVLEQASVMPIKYIRRLEGAVRAVGIRLVLTSVPQAPMYAPSPHCHVFSAARDMTLRAVPAIHPQSPATERCIRMPAHSFFSKT